MSLTALPFDEAKQILLQQKSDHKFHHPDIDGFLKKRYDTDRQLKEMFIAHGGKPQRDAPIYMMLGEHKQWYEYPAVIPIPLIEFDYLTVSFTYGDSFAVSTSFSPLVKQNRLCNRIACFASLSA